MRISFYLFDGFYVVNYIKPRSTEVVTIYFPTIDDAAAYVAGTSSNAENWRQKGGLGS